MLFTEQHELGRELRCSYCRELVQRRPTAAIIAIKEVVRVIARVEAREGSPPMDRTVGSPWDMFFA